MDKKICVWWDIATVEQYGKGKMTPRRLLEGEWYGFFNSCKQKLLDLIISRRNIKLQKLETMIIELKEAFIPFKDTPEYRDKNSQVHKYLEHLDRDTKNKKIKKYQRDLKDYREHVYKWQEESGEFALVQSVESSPERGEGAGREPYYTPIPRGNPSNQPRPNTRGRGGGGASRTPADPGPPGVRNQYEYYEPDRSMNYGVPTHNRFQPLQ